MGLDRCFFSWSLLFGAVILGVSSFWSRRSGRLRSWNCHSGVIVLGDEIVVVLGFLVMDTNISLFLGILFLEVVVLGAVVLGVSFLI
ncbi:hypothetical protein C2G38_2206256 [Gigaspora rosea]|uniref:Transmembrane protein n=1 Tax=Gigaspora rosea TaxID=44941 RepID=A0A397UJI6_9GLOM|nr:hypothetical protein C2G38_2206256 [Gigaspora rosea]